MTELEQYIKACFGVVETDDLHKITSLFKPGKLKKGDFLLKKDRICHKLSFVQSGLLRIFTIKEDKEITQWISKKGYFVADLTSFINNSVSRWTIQALTDTEIFSISKDDYNKLGQIVPKWTAFENWFIVNCFTTLEDRMFRHLSMSAEERYDAYFAENPELFNQVPLQYIASMLGMTPETLSRIRRKQLL